MFSNVGSYAEDRTPLSASQMTVATKRARQTSTNEKVVGVPCVLCTDFRADKVEWTRDHTRGCLVQCQRCRGCLFSMRDSPVYRRRWHAFLDRLHTPQSREVALVAEDRRAALAWKAKMQRKRREALERTERTECWVEDGRD
jgi:hypothetical protein